MIAEARRLEASARRSMFPTPNRGLASATSRQRRRPAFVRNLVPRHATNSARHGGGSGRLRLWLESSSLVCEIRDQGHFNRPLADRERPSGDIAAPRGLWLANQLCDLVQIRRLPDGTVVRLHKRLHPANHLCLVRD